MVSISLNTDFAISRPILLTSPMDGSPCLARYAQPAGDRQYARHSRLAQHVNDATDHAPAEPLIEVILHLAISACASCRTTRYSQPDGRIGFTVV
jgi:hypothetical protein